MSTPSDNPNSPPYRVQGSGDTPPSSPVYRPSSPVYRPSSPVYRPSSPVYRPSSPVYRPSSPVATPPPIFRPQMATNPPPTASTTSGKRHLGYGVWENIKEEAAPAKEPIPAAGEKKLHSANPNTIMSRKLLETYFRTVDYPFTRHHIDSFDQFLSQDLPAIIKSNNPFLILKELIPRTNSYMYRVEIFVGGLNGDEIEIGTPTIALQKATEVRVLFPNEARLRGLTYASTVYANVIVRITITMPDQVDGAEPIQPIIREYKRMPLFQIPILLHSRFCVLHGKPQSFLKEAGECPQDQGGYFVVDGSEKVLITRQEQAFNTFYVQKQPNNDKVATYGNITCLSSETRAVKVVSFNWMRRTETLQVTLPYVRTPVPIFMLFRALGVNSEKDILELIYPDLNSAEAKLVIPHLQTSIAESFPFLDTYSAVQFIKSMTKGFSEDHVYDILFNQTFIHISDKQGGSRAHFLADCVRKFMRVHLSIDPDADRDDTRNQRALTGGVLIRMLFLNAYNNWKKAVRLAVDNEYAHNKETYSGAKFVNIFSEGNTQKLFIYPGRKEQGRDRGISITDGIMRGFKGKWVTGGSGGGGAMGHSDEKSGVLQAMSRISYLDFMSHCRRVVLNFDTGMKLTRPRQLHGSQYGYFCTNETPGGSSIGITKNLSMMTMISTSSDPTPITRMLMERNWLIPCSEMRTDLLRISVPFFLNNGIIGYTLQPYELVEVLKLMKWTGCLPAMTSVGFSIRNRRVFLFLDEGRPTRPLIHLEKGGKIPKDTLASAKAWRNLVLGTLPLTQEHGLSTVITVDPLASTPGPIPLSEYKKLLEPHTGVIEYVDPYEQNEAFIINFPEHTNPEASHMEIHPCTIVSIVNGMIPFANYNQSPRNQLSCSQSKQALGMYATNFQNRYDNTANILSYGEAPLVRTLAYDVLGEGKMPYGHNLIMAIMSFQGYNQDDGIIFNEDSFQRGMFRNINYRSYTTHEEYDKLENIKTIIANPLRVTQWTDLRPGLDYTKLDDRGIIKVGEVVDENTVLVGKYIMDKAGTYKDASMTAQVWTMGRVESVVVTVNNMNNLMVKVRITQDRTPELGDKFSTRHGQKGTIGMRYRAHDLPRTPDGLVPDMLVNPHCIPSRMTIAQLLEMIFGEVCYRSSVIGDATIFMSDADAPEAIGRVLERQFGIEKNGNKIMYDGATGVQMQTSIFCGPVFTMRLKHMVEDKWNARAEGRREQRTHQPTGGRGAQGGLRIGEMERDGLAAHGITRFLRESMMERADKTEFRICNGCGTIPIFNARQNLFVCPLCDGPVDYIGTNVATMELLPTVKRSLATTSVVEMPYATKLLAEELSTYMNMGMRILTEDTVTNFRDPMNLEVLDGEMMAAALAKPLPEVVMPETRVPEYREKPVEDVLPSDENLYAMGVLQKPGEAEEGVAPEEDREAELGIVARPQQQFNDSASIFKSADENISTTPEYAPMTPEYAPMTPPPPPPPMQPMQPMQQGGYYQFVPTAPQQQQPQAQAFMVPSSYSGGGQQYMTAAPVVYQAPVPNAPNTIVIDTSPHAMDQAGFQEEMQAAARGMPVMGGGMRRHTTPRARAESPRRGPASVDGMSPQSIAKARITINKLG